MYKNVKLSLEAHEELTKLKAELIGMKGDPNLSYSDVILELIKFYREHQKSK
ncbi:hypothetical protein J7K06_05510 [Candidatus Bathyarchaeota archaeon]|nr:hypothetical protein [Candidatus Bathyarchaeota archaeon]